MITLESPKATSVRNGKNVDSSLLSEEHAANENSKDFLVKDPLPNVTFPINRNWAGSITVNRTNHPNDTLFFWAFEKDHGSLTSVANERSGEPWGIWLNGGPGASSIIGALFEV